MNDGAGKLKSIGISSSSLVIDQRGFEIAIQGRAGAGRSVRMLSDACVHEYESEGVSTGILPEKGRHTTQTLDQSASLVEWAAA